MPSLQRSTLSSSQRSGAAAWIAPARPAVHLAALPNSFPMYPLPELPKMAELPRVPSSLRLLIVEDDETVREVCAGIGHNLGFRVDTAENVPAARQILGQSGTDLVLLDVKLPGGGGYRLLQEIRQTQPRTVVVMMTAFATVHSAVEAMRLGAGDFLSKPFTLEELSAALERATERREWTDRSRTLREQFRAGKGTGMLVGESVAMQRLFRMMAKVAHTAHPVLISGEQGVGKEVVARAIHANGGSEVRPFLPVDCGSLRPGLLDLELFGSVEQEEQGLRAKTGLLSAAAHGTLFLDGIHELGLDVQAKLLRTLQEKQFCPHGATDPVPLRARLLASTHCHLPSLVSAGKFRKDLFYRFNVVNMQVPALRDRKSDLPLLAEHILSRLRREHGTSLLFSDESLEWMMEYDWPGNVRELEHAIECASAMASGPLLQFSDLPHGLQSLFHEIEPNAPRELPIPESLAQVIPLADLERQAIASALRQFAGDKLHAAKVLGIGKTTLYRKLKEYGIAEYDA